MRPTLELGMKLARDKMWMIAEFNDLDQSVIRACSTQSQACVFQSLSVVVVELKAVSMSLGDFLSTVNFLSAATRNQFAGVSA